MRAAWRRQIALVAALPIIASLLAAASGALAQVDSIDEIDAEQLRRVLPGASYFTPAESTLLIYAGYTGSEPEAELAGYVFFTPDLPPEEIGYSAPIDMLVGMDTEGTVTGLEIVHYTESYKAIRGDFIHTEGFPQQFAGMDIAEGFRVGRDIDGISRATITAWAVARGIRNAARRVALEHLPDADYVRSTNADGRALQFLEGKSWDDFKADGLVRELDVEIANGTTLHLEVVFMAHDGLGELLVGADDYSRAEREASARVNEGNLVLVGIDGDSSMPFRQERLAVEQDGKFMRLERRRFVYVGSADNGKIAGEVRFAGAMVLDDSIDISRPFTVHYDLSDQLAQFGYVASLEYQVPSLPLALAQGTELPPEFSEFDADDIALTTDTSRIAYLIETAPPMQTGALLFLLALVSISFATKNSTLRWTTLAFTLVYLGWIDGGFLSVSHITNVIKQGPSMFLTDLPTLIIVVFTVATTLFWGRVFCSSLCPFGALQDFISRFLPRHFQKELPRAVHNAAIYIKYGVLAFLLLMAVAAADLSLFQYFEPFGTIFYFSQSVWLWVILFGFLAGSIFISRFYCRYACPLGAALGVVSMVSPFRIKRVRQCVYCKVCEHSCPTGAIHGPKIDFKECVRCDDCESKLIHQAGVCRHPVEEVRSRIKHPELIAVG